MHLLMLSHWIPPGTHTHTHTELCCVWRRPEKYGTMNFSCEEKKCTMKNMTAIIALWSIITFLFFNFTFFFFFWPRLIIKFNYSGSVFLICFPHFLANWLCIPIFSCLLLLRARICWHRGLTHMNATIFFSPNADNCTSNVLQRTSFLYELQQSCQGHNISRCVNCDFFFFFFFFPTTKNNYAIFLCKPCQFHSSPRWEASFPLLAHSSKLQQQVFSFSLPPRVLALDLDIEDQVILT